MKKMNIKSKLVGVVAVASAFFIGATPLTAFAQANAESEEVEVEVVEKDVITDAEETEVEAEIPYHYTVNEDGSIVFSFNGYFSVQRGLMYFDKMLSQLDCEASHTVHPHGYFG